MENNISDKIKISKETIATLPVESFPGKIVVVDTDGMVNKAITELQQESIIGFDTETRPTFKKGRSNHVALVQLSTHDTCYLFRINRIGFAPALKQLLENEKYLKVGISLKDDFCMLNRLNNEEFTPRNFIELQKVVKKFGIEDQSLQKIYGIVVGKKISKGQRLSNWEADHLSESQQLYAATDAWSCIKIYEKLQSGRFVSPLNPTLLQHSTSL
ncbi:MAG TPA: 3'-5' exonuclease domain-containing protein 2 [Candidatus Barnesiella excrementigallinarum]|nr:3'-5' exonuclease domain-containing protein 2 [Candidatus Barnesiella excrementigallinarum]